MSSTRYFEKLALKRIHLGRAMRLCFMLRKLQETSNQSSWSRYSTWIHHCRSAECKSPVKLNYVSVLWVSMLGLYYVMCSPLLASWYALHLITGNLPRWRQTIDRVLRKKEVRIYSSQLQDSSFEEEIQTPPSGRNNDSWMWSKDNSWCEWLSRTHTKHTDRQGVG